MPWAHYSDCIMSDISVDWYGHEKGLGCGFVKIYKKDVRREFYPHFKIFLVKVETCYRSSNM